MQLVGLIPAAGMAKRLGPIPCSKEIFPVDTGTLINRPHRQLKGCCLNLLESMQTAGVEKAYVVIRKGKWDIPAYLGDGSHIGVSLAYLIMNAPFGVPFSLDQAYLFTRDAMVLFGFPDILFWPEDAYPSLLQRQQETRADIVLGLFEAGEPGKVDTVRLNTDGSIAGIEVKNAASEARYCWIIAVWAPTFTEYLHHFVTDFLHVKQQLEPPNDPGGESHIGSVIADALQDGLRVAPYIFKNGRFLDIGTFENLMKAPIFTDSHF